MSVIVVRTSSFFLFWLCSDGAVQQCVVGVPALLAFDGALRRELALSSPVLLQTTEADVHEDFLSLPQSFVEGKTLKLGAICKVVLAAALVAVLLAARLSTSWRLRRGGV
jgi:hypothetical protein